MQERKDKQVRVSRDQLGQSETYRQRLAGSVKKWQRSLEVGGLRGQTVGGLRPPSVGLAAGRQRTLLQPAAHPWNVVELRPSAQSREMAAHKYTQSSFELC